MNELALQSDRMQRLDALAKLIVEAMDQWEEAARDEEPPVTQAEYIAEKLLWYVDFVRRP